MGEAGDGRWGKEEGDVSMWSGENKQTPYCIVLEWQGDS